MSFKETLFGIVPDDWSVSKIGDIAQLRQGLQISSKLRIQEKKENYIPLLKITDLPSRQFSEYVTNIPENYIASKEDIIYTRTGQVGLVYTDVEGCVHNNCFKVIFDYNKFDKYYMYYYLKSNRVEQYANNIATGSVQKDLTHTAFNTCKVGYPTLQEQKKIGKILFDLDNKIEVNNKINQRLEDMAQSIFKHWFVDFEFPNEKGKPYKSSGGEMVESELGMIPKGWEVKKIKDFGEVITGKTPSTKKEENYGDRYPFITIPDMHNSMYINKTVRYLSEEGNNVQSKKLIPKDSLIVSCIATVGLVSINTVESHTNQQINSIVPNNKELLPYLYFDVKSKSEYLNLLGSSGTTTKNVNKTSFENIKLLYPNEKILHKYYNTVQNVFIKSKKNIIENERLIDLRDALLPKLMSGDIEVPLG